MRDLVSVKTLKWQQLCSMHRAPSPFGIFTYWTSPQDGSFQWAWEAWDQSDAEDYGGSAPSLEAAKSAAEADYERRAREILTPSPLAGELVKALEAAQAWIADGGHAERGSGADVYQQITGVISKLKEHGDE